MSAKRKTPLEMITLKLTATDRKRMAANAKRYAGGNLSAWIRRASKQFVPATGTYIPAKGKKAA